MPATVSRPDARSRPRPSPPHRSSEESKATVQRGAIVDVDVDRRPTEVHGEHGAPTLERAADDDGVAVAGDGVLGVAAAQHAVAATQGEQLDVGVEHLAMRRRRWPVTGR